MIYRLTAAVAIFLIVTFIITQIIIPALRGTKAFPMFRREAKLKDELLSRNQQEYEQSLEKEVATRSVVDIEAGDFAPTTPQEPAAPNEEKKQ